jgi:uncharacterized lipoprotein YehR (DUF1307 family)
MIKIVKTTTTTEYVDEDELKTWLKDLMEIVGYDKDGLDSIEAFEYYLTEDFDLIEQIHKDETSKVEFDNKEEIKKMLEEVKAYWQKKWGCHA